MPDFTPPTDWPTRAEVAEFKALLAIEDGVHPGSLAPEEMDHIAADRLAAARAYMLQLHEGLADEYWKDDDDLEDDYF